MARDLLALPPHRPRDLLAPAATATAGTGVYEESLARASEMSQVFNREPEAPEPSFMDNLLGALGYAGQTAQIGADRFGEGMANLAGLPVDAANFALELGFRGADTVIPGDQSWLKTSSNPVGGSDNLNDIRTLFGATGYEAPVPQDAFQTVIGRVAEEVGASALPVGALAIQGARTGARAAREAGDWFSRTFLAPAAANPAKFVGAEAAGAAAAGTGAGIANLFADRDTTGGQVADMLGALGGAGAFGVATTLGRGLGQAFNAIRQNPNYIDQVVKDAVVDRIGKAAGLDGADAPMDTDVLLDAITRGGASPSDTIPGFQESLADTTGNPGLAALEYSRQSGPNAGQFTTRRSANNEAVDQVMEAIAPQQTPGAFRSELEAQRDLRLAAAADQVNSAQSQFDQIIQNLQPAMTADARGAELRAALEDASDEAKAIVSAAWEPINRSGVQIDMAPLADEYGDIRSGLSVAETRRFLPDEAGIPKELVKPEVPPTETGILDASGRPIMRAGTPASGIQPINEVTGLRSALSDAANEAANAGRPNEARIIREHIKALDDYFDAAIPSELAAQYDAAKTARREYGDRFERPPTAVAQTLAKTDGAYRVNNSNVAPKFVQPDEGRLSDFDDLIREAGNDPRTREAIRDQILADIERSQALTDPDKLQRHLDRYSTVFQQFPDLRDEVAEAITSRRSLDEAGAAQTNLVRELGDGTQPGKGTVGRYLQYSDANAERAITEVLNSKDPAAAADELLTFIGDNPSAVEGARAAFWQKLKSEAQSTDNSQRTMGGTRAWRGDWLKSFLDKPATAAVAERLYRDNPDHLANIRDIANVLDNVDLRQRGKAVGTSGTAQGTTPILTPETLQSRFYAFMRGQVSGTYLATSIAAVIARRAVRNAQTSAIEAMTDKALLNPEFAAELLKENNPANRAAMARKVRAWLGNEASTFVNLLDQADEDDEDGPNIEDQRQPLRVIVEADEDNIIDAVQR